MCVRRMCTQNFMAVAQHVSICQLLQCNTALYFSLVFSQIFPFPVLSFFHLLFFSQPRFLKRVVCTLEELPCTSIHMSDVHAQCESSGQRILLPGPELGCKGQYRIRSFSTRSYTVVIKQIQTSHLSPVRLTICIIHVRQ